MYHKAMVVADRACLAYLVVENEILRQVEYKIDFSAAELLILLIAFHLTWDHLDIRVLGCESAYNCRLVRCLHKSFNAYGDEQAFTFMRRNGAVKSIVKSGKQLYAVNIKALTCVGEGHLSCASLEKRKAQLIFKSFYLHADRRLSHAALFGRLCKAHISRNGTEYLNSVKLHCNLPSIDYIML